LGGDESSDDGIPLEEPETAVALPVPGYDQEGLDPLDAEPLRVTADTLDTPSPANLAQPPEPAAPAVADSEPSAPPAEPTTTATPPKPEEASEAAPETAAPRPSLPEVVLSFSGTSWIDVRDAAGKVILTGEMRKGDRRVLKGEPPYSFVIGNAKAAALTVGEKPLDLSARGRGGVARFKLDPDNPE
jgi:cytoskeleton protein RodZ